MTLLVAKNPAIPKSNESRLYFFKCFPPKFPARDEYSTAMATICRHPLKKETVIKPVTYEECISFYQKLDARFDEVKAVFSSCGFSNYQCWKTGCIFW